LRFWVILNKGSSHVRPHFKGFRPNARPQPRYYFSSFYSKTSVLLMAKTLKYMLKNTLATQPCQTAPPGMRRRNLGALIVGEQHWQTIGHHDGAGQMV